MKRLVASLCLVFTTLFSAQAAKVDTLSIYSPSMNKNIKCVVVLPEKYVHATSAELQFAEYPTLYLLHGYSGNYSDWVRNSPNFLKSVDEYGIITICPDGGYGSWYFDSPIVPAYRYETFVSKELVAYVNEHYKVGKDRSKRAIAGLSMGGHGAMYLAINHLETFGAACAMSGGVDFRPFPNNWSISQYLGAYESNKDVWEKHTVQYLVEHALQNNLLAISIDCGVDDFFIGVNRQLHKTLVEKKIDHDYAERPGEHNWAYWNNSISYQMLFLHKFFGK